MNDNRTVHRVSTKRPVSVYIDGNKLEGKMIDISEIGAGIIMNSVCLENSNITLSFNLNSSKQSICVKGKIIHSYKVKDKCLVGIVFLEASNEKTQNEILNFVQHSK